MGMAPRRPRSPDSGTWDPNQARRNTTTPQAGITRFSAPPSAWRVRPAFPTFQIDRRRQGVSRPCAAGAGAGRCRGGSGAQDRTACKKDVRRRLPNRSRDELAAASHACAARRAEEHPGHDLERLFAGPRRGGFCTSPRPHCVAEDAV